MFKILSGVFSVFFLFAGGLTAQILTPEQAVEKALSNNYDIMLARVGKEISGRNVTYGNAGMLPSVDVNFSQNNSVQDTRQEFLDGRGVSRDNAFTGATNIGAVLNWTIFDGFQMFFNYNRLQQMDLMEEAVLKQQVENTVFSVLQAYYEVVLQEQLLYTYKESIELSQEKLNLIQTRVELGTAARAELLQARLDLNRFRSEFLRQHTLVGNAKTTLNEIMGQSTEYDYEVSDSVVFENNLRPELLLEEMNRNNKQLLQLDRSKSIARTDVRSSYSPLFPRVNVHSGYSLVNHRSEAGFLVFNQSAGWNYGITASWRVFEGFNRSRLSQISRLNLYYTETAYNATKLALSSSLQRHYNNYQNNQEILELENENILLARQNIELALDRYEAGVISAIELREAEISFNDAANRLVNARYNTKIAELELLRISGTIIREE